MCILDYQWMMFHRFTVLNLIIVVHSLFGNLDLSSKLLCPITCVTVVYDTNLSAHAGNRNNNRNDRRPRRIELHNAKDGIFVRVPFRIHRFRARNRIGFINASVYPTNSKQTTPLYSITLNYKDDTHKYLKELYINRDIHLSDEFDEECYLYRYFNITKGNIEAHLNKTMDEYFENMKERNKRQPYIIDGTRFNGDYSTWTLPIPRNLSSYSFEGINPNMSRPVDAVKDEVKPDFNDEMLSSIYDLITEDVPSPKNDTMEFCDLYEEVGDNEYTVFDDFKLYKKECLQDVCFMSNDETKKKRQLLHQVMMHPTVFPSYLDPDNPVQRTGRRRELQRKSDSGRLQRLRWNMDVDPENDILRGNWTRGDPITKEFLDSIEWEQPMPTYHDRNYFKRSYYEGGFGEEDRTLDNYFDVQFIGSTDAYPFAVSAGMQFSWPIYWVPLLCKQHPKRRGQPIRSQMFNLGGIEPLQLWFYPEGSASSLDGYCSLKLVSPPGWCIPYRIYLFVYSEYNYITLGPMYRESADYIASSINTCRIIDKSDKELLENPENNRDYVIMGPAGNVYVGVGVVDEPLRKHSRKYEFRYDWDEGDYDFNQWLKKQTADPDDEHSQETVEKDRTHSLWYESHKYKYVPDRHITRYWKTRFNKKIKWTEPDF